MKIIKFRKKIQIRATSKKKKKKGEPTLITGSKMKRNLRIEMQVQMEMFFQKN